MAWLRLSITCRPPYLDDLRDLLEKFAAESISFSPVSDEPVFGDGEISQTYWEKTSVSALFMPDIDLDILLACIRNKLGADNIDDYGIEAVADQAWLETHKAGFHPMVFGGRLCVCPSWCRKPDDVALVIELDPGLAFGTGTHATTALCLEWLAGQELGGLRVIDYGCGSGILAMAAAKLGATHVTAVDIDEQALTATRTNSLGNGLERIISVLPAGDPGLCGGDILIANILLKPLLTLAPVFAGLLEEGGKLVLSGLLASQCEECIAAYRPWFEIGDPLYQDEWAMLAGTRIQSD